jgi:hypothetical protein
MNYGSIQFQTAKKLGVMNVRNRHEALLDELTIPPPRPVFSAKLIQIQALRKRTKRSFAVRIEISQFDQPGSF